MTLITLGWREWVSLPELGIKQLKAKVDTGARTSAIHTFYTELHEQGGVKRVRFGLHPVQDNAEIEQICEAKLLDERQVTDSGGHSEIRYVIETLLVIGISQRRIEITLTQRDNMKFRMLLGRTALNEQFIVNPAESYLIGKPST